LLHETPDGCCLLELAATMLDNDAEMVEVAHRRSPPTGCCANWLFGRSLPAA